MRMRQGRVEGKVIVVTGAAQGIGFACAQMLAEEGAAVVLSDLKQPEGEAAAARIQAAGGKALFVQADVTSEIACAHLMDEAARVFGRVDGLLNNAGWYPRATLEETTTDLWDQIQNVNLRGPFYCCKHAAPHLRAAGGGSIVNVGSLNGIQGLPNLVAYAAAKGGLLSMTRTLAGALAHDRIRVNYLIPGWVLTEGEIALHAKNGVTLEALQKRGESLALGRHQSVEDSAYASLYLLSDESAQVTGTILNVDAGGSTLPIQPGAPYVG
ncbi:MAG TPA: SDR family oxidoreductase [Bryobacteraceae bacterium]|nr:SDR family oxidoreductase [Bryobacteraceae bacterium]